MALYFLKGIYVEICQNCYCFLSSLLKCDKFNLSSEKTLTKGTDTITKVGLSSSIFVMQCYLIVYLPSFLSLFVLYA